MIREWKEAGVAEVGIVAMGKRLTHSSKRNIESPLRRSVLVWFSSC